MATYHFPWYAVAGLGMGVASNVASSLSHVPVPGGPSIIDEIKYVRALYVWGVSTDRWQRLYKRAQAGELGHFQPVADLCFRVSDSVHSLELRFNAAAQQVEVRPATGTHIHQRVLRRLRSTLAAAIGNALRCALDV